jgi:hypothetical protein
VEVVYMKLTDEEKEYFRRQAEEKRRWEAEEAAFQADKCEDAKAAEKRRGSSRHWAWTVGRWVLGIVGFWLACVGHVGMKFAQFPGTFYVVVLIGLALFGFAMFLRRPFRPWKAILAVGFAGVVTLGSGGSGTLLGCLVVLIPLFWREKRGVDEPAQSRVTANEPRHDPAADGRLVPSRTEDKLRRLAMLVALASAIGFGGASAYSFYMVHRAQESVEIWSSLLSKATSQCSTYQEPAYCDGVEDTRKDFHGAVAWRDTHSERTEVFLAAAIAIPILSFLLFFGLRWVLIGRVRVIRASNQQEPNH